MTAFSAAFLDRDGTVIRDGEYPSDPDAVELLPGASEAIAALNARGVPVVIVTNQSGIGRGLYDEAAFRAVQGAVERKLRDRGARVDAVYHCPHDPGATRCECRKPGTALFERAAADLGGLDLTAALYVGDRAHDVLPGLRLGGHAFLVRSGPVTDLPPAGCEVAADLHEAVRRALGSGWRPEGPPVVARDSGRGGAAGGEGRAR